MMEIDVSGDRIRLDKELNDLDRLSLISYASWTETR